MKDFFDQFRDNLAGRPEPEFDPQDWQNLEKRLDESPVQRRLALPLLGWRWLPFALLLLGTNTAFWLELRRAAHTIERLENSRDTVFVTTVIPQKDTVWLSTVQYRTLVAPWPKAKQDAKEQQAGNTAPTIGQKGFAEQKPQEFPAAQPGKSPFINENQKLISDSANTSLTVGASPERATATFADTTFAPAQVPAANSPDIPSIADSLAEETRAAKLPSRRKTFEEHLIALRPKTFTALASGGLAMPPRAGRHLKPGYTLGLAAEIGFSKNLRLWADVHFQQNHLKTTSMDAALGVPPVVPPNDDLVFTEATADEKFRQFSLGMAHVFRPLGHWRPLIGVGWGIRFAQGYDLSYDFENHAQGISWKYETEVRPADGQTQFALLRAGVEWAFLDHWRLQLNSGMRSDFGTGGMRRPRFVGLHLGVGRQF